MNGSRDAAATLTLGEARDLHHIATEYPTTWKGEAEIGAWEIGSGCSLRGRLKL